MLSRLITFLSLSIVLLVPWQARYIVEPTMLGGVSWEYTTHSLYAVEVLAWVLFYLYFFQLVKTRHVAEPSLFLPIKRRHRLVVVSAIVVVLSAVLWASQDRQLAWVYLFRLLESFCLLLILATEVRRRPDMFLGVFWLSGVGQGILALVQFGVQKVFSWAWSGIAPQEASRLGMFVIEVGGERWLRAYGSFGSPAQLGSFLAGALVVGALIIVVFDSKKYEKWIVLGQAVVTLGLLVSFARSAWAAALLIGLVLSRFGGDFYALGSFGFNIIVYSLFLNWQELTRGPLGIPGIPRPTLFGINFANNFNFLCLVAIVVLLVYLLSRFIVNSSFGRVLKAIREDEEAIQVFGYQTNHYKLAIFVIGAGLAAVAGSLFASYITFIDPSSFVLFESIFILAIIILGGLANLRGSLLGALFLVLLPEALRFVGFPAEVAAQLRQVVYGLILVLLMLYRPQGLVGEYKL